MEDSSCCVEEQRRSHQILSFKLDRILQTHFVFVFYIFVPYILCLCLCSNKLFPIFLTTYKNTFPVLYPSIRPLIFCLISGFISKNKKKEGGTLFTMLVFFDLCTRLHSWRRKWHPSGLAGFTVASQSGTVEADT